MSATGDAILDGGDPVIGFHSRPAGEERYNYLYSKEELVPWLDRIPKAQATLSETAAEESAVRGVYAILNNSFRGQVVANAFEVENGLFGRSETIPESARETYPALAAISRAPPPRQRKLF